LTTPLPSCYSKKQNRGV